MSSISFDKEGSALSICEMRASMIARNLSNTNTPQYKARDLNFQEAMQQASVGGDLDTSHPNHISSSSGNGINQTTYYRVPMQSKLDDNTVDDEIERKNFIENSLRYQTSLGFIERKGTQYIKAIRGE
ncbi:MAG: flagellar basal body rod protein FlgB [Legionellales bacterium]